MAAKWIEALTGSLEQKKQYKQITARLDELPEPHRTAALALKRYLMYAGGVVDGDVMMQMFSDFTDLWEQAAVDGTPVHDIVGDDPVDFAESFAQAYGGAHWIDKERARLIRAIGDAEEGGRQ